MLVGTILQVGGTIGTFGLAWLIARGGFVPMLTTTFAVATVSIALIGQPGLSLALLSVIVFIAGWGVIGGQPGINALSATYYPTSLRSTGVGWGLGIGRIGAIVGPYLGGELLGLAVGTAGAVLRGGGPGAHLDADDDRASLYDEAARRLRLPRNSQRLRRTESLTLVGASSLMLVGAILVLVGATLILSVRSLILVGAILRWSVRDPGAGRCDH